jgi:hypothetical protein
MNNTQYNAFNTDNKNNIYIPTDFLKKYTTQIESILNICHNSKDFYDNTVINLEGIYTPFDNIDNIDIYNYEQEFNELKKEYDNFIKCSNIQNTTNINISFYKNQLIKDYEEKINTEIKQTNLENKVGLLANTESIDKFKCISKEIHRLNLKLYELYLKNLQRIEQYKNIAPII